MSGREQLLSMRALGGTGYLCSSPPGQEYLAGGSFASAPSSTSLQTPLDLVSTAQAIRQAKSWPGVPWQAYSTEGGRGGAGECRQVQLFSSLSLAWKHSLITVRSEQLAHFYTYPAPCLRFGLFLKNMPLTGRSTGGTYFSHLQLLRNCRKKTEMFIRYKARR